MTEGAPAMSSLSKIALSHGADDWQTPPATSGHLGAQIPFLHDTRTEVFKEDVGLASQLPCQLPAFLMMQVDGDTAPVPPLCRCVLLIGILDGSPTASQVSSRCTPYAKLH